MREGRERENWGGEGWECMVELKHEGENLSMKGRGRPSGGC